MFLVYDMEIRTLPFQSFIVPLNSSGVGKWLEEVSNNNFNSFTFCFALHIGLCWIIISLGSEFTN